LGGGAFQAFDKRGGESLALSMEATPGVAFDLDLTGEGMTAVEPNALVGPRVKVLEPGSLCGSSPIPATVEGLLCQRPQGADLLSVMICTTTPDVATRYLHRWRGIKVNGCGDYMVCHCNANCDKTQNWKEAGKVRVRPVWTFGSMAQAPPGCEAFLPTAPPPVSRVTFGGASSTVTVNETLSVRIISLALSISGGLPKMGPPLEKALEAVQLALATYVSAPSGLLQLQVPEPDDVTVAVFAGRRLPEVHGERRAQGEVCADDDATFAAEAKKVSFPLGSCKEALQMLNNVDTLCNDPTLKDAVAKGCKLTCGICIPEVPTVAPSNDTVSLTTPSPSSIVWPGGDDALRLTLEVRTRTDWSGDGVMA
ncbi:unnamed protein product, partial [Polarella glacialis]